LLLFFKKDASYFAQPIDFIYSLSGRTLVDC